MLLAYLASAPTLVLVSLALLVLLLIASAAEGAPRDELDALEAEAVPGRTMVYALVGGHVRGSFAIADRIKPVVAGGPVVLPGTYDGKNRTFWLANYEGTRIRTGVDEFRTIPTPDMLAGRFTSTVLDPLTGDPFPNNVIPESRFSRLGNLARQKFFPAPNIQLPQGNYRLTRSLPADSNQQTYRLDQQLGSLGTLFGRITAGGYTNSAAGSVLPMELAGAPSIG